MTRFKGSKGKLCKMMTSHFSSCIRLLLLLLLLLLFHMIVITIIITIIQGWIKRLPIFGLHASTFGEVAVILKW